MGRLVVGSSQQRGAPMNNQAGDIQASCIRIASTDELAVAGRRSSVTVVMNGGQIADTDVAASLGSGRPVVVLAGSGRTADAIAKARAGNGGDNRAVEIAASPLTTVADVGEAGMAAAAI